MVIRKVSNCPNTAMTNLMKNALVLDLCMAQNILSLLGQSMARLNRQARIQVFSTSRYAPVALSLVDGREEGQDRNKQKCDTDTFL